MATQIKNSTKTEYRDILKKQDIILKELRQIKMLNAVERFEKLAKRGRQFAKARKIKRGDVLRND